MTAFWKKILSYVLLFSAFCFITGNGMMVQNACAQDADEETAVSEEEATAEESAEEEGEVAEETVVEEPVSKPVLGPDPNAKGSEASDFMHCATDEKATDLDLEALLTDSQRKYIDVTAKLPDQAKNKGAILKLGNEVIQLANQVLPAEVLQENRGEIIRFHIWIKADENTAEKNLWNGAPSLLFKLYDDNGNQVASVASSFKTRGTYPWHNYYVDLQLPRNFALSGKVKASTNSDSLLNILGMNSDVKNTQPGLYLTLTNLGGGTAWFGGMTYERIDAKAHNRSDKWLDDATASMAPNPQYDELPMMLFFGLDTKLPWRFLEGNAAYKDIRSIEGVKAYLASAKDDWFQMQKGVARLPYLFVTADVLQLTDGFEEGWMDAIRYDLEAAQDSKTGFWTINGTPNLLVTYALVTQCFSPMSINHADRKATPTPWNATSPEATVRFAAEMVKTLLAERVTDTPAWNNFAFQGKDIPGVANKTDLLATSAAVQLLVRAKEQLTPEDKEYDLAENAIKAAYEYAIGTYVLKNQKNLWRDNSATGSIALSPEGMFELFDVTSVLENRINDSLPLPKVSCERKGGAGLGKAIDSWDGSDKELVAVRIYAAPDEVNPSLLSEKHLIGVLEKPNAAPKAQDPLMLVYRMANAAKLQWGVTPMDFGAEYVTEKLANLAKFLGGTKRLTVGTTGEKSVTMNVASPIAFGYPEDEAESVNIKIYAAGVNAFGEVTRCIPLDAENSEE